MTSLPPQAHTPDANVLRSLSGPSDSVFDLKQQQSAAIDRGEYDWESDGAGAAEVQRRRQRLQTQCIQGTLWFASVLLLLTAARLTGAFAPFASCVFLPLLLLWCRRVGRQRRRRRARGRRPSKAEAIEQGLLVVVLFAVGGALLFGGSALADPIANRSLAIVGGHGRPPPRGPTHRGSPGPCAAGMSQSSNMSPNSSSNQNSNSIGRLKSDNGDGPSSDDQWAAPWCKTGSVGLLCRPALRSKDTGQSAASAGLDTAAALAEAERLKLQELDSGGSGLTEFKRLLALTWKDSWLFSSGLLFLFFGAGFKSLVPIAFSRAMADLTKAKPWSTGLGGFRKHIVAILILGLGTSAFTGLRSICMGTVTARLLKRLRSLVYASIVEKDLAWHDEREVGELASRVNADCASVSQSLTVHLNVFLRSSMSALFGAAYLFKTSRALSGALLGVWLLLAVLTNCYGRFTRKIAVLKQDRTAELNQAASEDFGLIRVIRAYGLEERQNDRFEELSDHILDLDMRRFAAYSGFMAASSWVANLMSTATLAAGVSMVSRGTMGADQLIACLMYVREVVDSSFDAIDQFTSLQQTAGKAKRVFDIIDWGAPNETVAVHPVNKARTGLIIPEKEFKGHIQFRDLNFTYPNRPGSVFRGLTLDIPPGKTIALVGSSGSGKSTVAALVQQMYKVEQPDGLLLDGYQIQDLDHTWLRQHIAVVTQEPRLFADTVFNNIAAGAHDLDIDPKELWGAVKGAAMAANAHDFIEELPQGYHTKVGDMKLLSGGQRQRVAIARALMRRPKILILDEATSALDTRSEATVQAAIDSILANKNMTCIMIAHRLSTVRNADMIAVLERGQLVELGNFKELVRRRGGYFAKLAAEQGLAGGGNPTGFLSAGRGDRR